MVVYEHLKRACKSRNQADTQMQCSCLNQDDFGQCGMCNEMKFVKKGRGHLDIVPEMQWRKAVGI